MASCPNPPSSSSGPASASALKPVRRWSRTGPRTVAVPDAVAMEEPLELRVDSRSVAVLMRTPGHDEELAAGFLLTEGVITSARDLLSVKRHPRNREGNVLDVFLAEGVSYDPGRLTRNVFAASSCGMCGAMAIDAVRRHFPKVRSELRLTAEALLGLPPRMREAQAGFAASGGIHAAALFEEGRELLAVREDVGRHNAVDKLLGWAVANGLLPLSNVVLVVSGRASFEILHKALAGGVPIVAAVSAPSSLAVEFAHRNGQTLVGFLRDDRFNVYSRPGRIRGV